MDSKKTEEPESPSMTLWDMQKCIDTRVPTAHDRRMNEIVQKMEEHTWPKTQIKLGWQLLRKGARRYFRMICRVGWHKGKEWGMGVVVCERCGAWRGH